MWKSLVILALALALVQLVDGMSTQGRRGHGRKRPQRLRTAVGGSKRPNRHKPMAMKQNLMEMEDDAPGKGMNPVHL